jgi:hypothetical protein
MDEVSMSDEKSTIAGIRRACLEGMGLLAPGEPPPHTENEMSYKPAATANDFQRWKSADITPPMQIERVVLEGIIQNKRAKFDITAEFARLRDFYDRHKDCDAVKPS